MTGAFWVTGVSFLGIAAWIACYSFSFWIFALSIAISASASACLASASACLVALMISSSMSNSSSYWPFLPLFFATKTCSSEESLEWSSRESCLSLNFLTCLLRVTLPEVISNPSTASFGTAFLMISYSTFFYSLFFFFLSPLACSILATFSCSTSLFFYSASSFSWAVILCLASLLSSASLFAFSSIIFLTLISFSFLDCSSIFF